MLTKKLKVITVLGTRPEVIKLAPVINELKKHRSKIISKVLLTGQHRSMVDQFLELFSIKPDYDLDIMVKDQTLSDVSSRCMLRLAKVLEKEKPDLILVEGDTTTAFIASLCAFYLKIPTGHVEAGLRTFDKYRPFPEEINRQLLSVVADLHFAPTQRAKDNLLREHVNPRKIFLTGNTVIDALFSVAGLKHDFNDDVLKGMDFERKKVILVTAHRRESFGGPMLSICKAIRDISSVKDAEIIYPVHLNPHVQKPVRRILGNKKNVYLLRPLDYPTFVHLLKKCYLVLTDSGGVQEEAPAFGKPIIVMREVTERQEGVDAGVARLVGMDPVKIVRETKRLLFSPAKYNAMAKSKNPYGDGHAAERIVKVILSKLEND